MRADGTFSPDFDRPSPGYAYPSTSSSQPPMDAASFMEEASEEYSALDDMAIVKAGQGEKATAIEAARLGLTNRQMRERAFQRLETCLDRRQLDLAITWLQRSPSCAQVEDANPYFRLLSRLQTALLATEGKNLDILIEFALTVAAKHHHIGHGRSPLIAHIARYSPPTRLKKFWRLYTLQARLASEGAPLRSRLAVERNLEANANIVIRQLALAGRFRDAVEMVLYTRSGQIRPNTNLSASFRYHPKAVIQESTYRILVQELGRHQSDRDLIRMVVSLQNEDWPLSATPIRSLDPERHAKVVRLRIAQMKAPQYYRLLSHRITVGILPTSNDMGRLLKKSRGSHGDTLVRALRRQVDRYKNAEEAARLRETMIAGGIPTAKGLAGFVQRCLKAGAPEDAVTFGQWMLQQHPRHRSLWHTARIYRLVSSSRRGVIGRGDHERAARALFLYAREFNSVGLPNPMVDYMRTEWPNELTAGGHLKLWPSSHTITLAIGAWLKLKPTYENIMSTYSSFVKESYQRFDPKPFMPRQVLPDQTSFQPFLVALVKLRKADDAFDILREMASRGVMPSAHNWDVVLGAYAAKGDLDLVDSIMQRRIETHNVVAEAENADADVLAFDADLKVLESGDRPSQDKPFAKQFSSFFTSAQGLVPAEGSDSKGQVDQAFKLDDFRFPAADTVSYRSIISGFCKAKCLEAAMVYKKRLYEARKPDGSLLYKWRDNLQTDTALSVLDSMVSSAERRYLRYERGNVG